MSIRKPLFLILLAIMSTHSVFADDYDITVCKLQAHINGKAYLRPCENWISKNSCSSDNWIVWGLDSDAGKVMYSTALTAFAANKMVTVRMNGTSCDAYDVTNMIRISNN